MVIVIALGAISFAGVVPSLPEINDENFLYQLTDPNEEDGILLLKKEDFLGSLDEVSPYTLDALIAIEDQRFYRHSGIDMIRILGAVLANIESGFGTEGGSTITQQLVKITYLDQSEKTLRRKIIEALTALRIEGRYSKEEILLSYLNKVYFGYGGYGLKNATESYFGKDPIELGLEESAIITGIIQNPTMHSPINNPESMIQRAKIVLSRMLEQGYINEVQEESARENLDIINYIKLD